MGNATEEIFTGIVNKLNNTGGIDFASVHRILITCLLLYIVSAIASYIQGFIMSTVTQRYTYRLRNRLNERYTNYHLSI